MPVSRSARSAHLIVPGLDRSETKVFFPPFARSESARDSRWQTNYPVAQLASDLRDPIRCLIPRLPDDPKGRFLTDLDRERKHGDDLWHSVKSLDQFWEQLSYRQECAAGKLVGFIWVLFPALDGNITDAQASSLKNSHESQNFAGFRITEHPRSAEAQDVLLKIGRFRELKDKVSNRNVQKQIDEHIAALKMEAEWHDNDVNNYGKIHNEALLLDQAAYDIMMDLMLDSDFAGAEAVTSTKKWISDVAKLAYIQPNDWSVAVTGTREITTEAAYVTSISIDEPQVNILTAVKREATH